MVKAFTVKKARGFTLVEVMFALAVFGLAALAALMVATQQIHSTQYLQERYFAQLVASNQLAEAAAPSQLSKKWPPQNNDSGSVELAGQTWYWQQRVLETVTDDLREVTISVRTEENGPVVAELSTFVGRR
ncbi:type II secretion system protein GspI [Aliidiomarina taiwanensis]|uniref:Type II secretion system protein I n=1 Tax=Aliidiomarina taiwanensis TaxID=946228 RepID=A0A432X801_9GAMM|nr:type II secretion system minor pseudopilin GspI [Aliidiomarina taiwanensis]RUO42988.1 type II secretion system protein GspI [Aliidiomarina taiwanensis]